VFLEIDHAKRRSYDELPTPVSDTAILEAPVTPRAARAVPAAPQSMVTQSRRFLRDPVPLCRKSASSGTAVRSELSPRRTKVREHGKHTAVAVFALW
jgi:hypothetical protein